MNIYILNLIIMNTRSEKAFHNVTFEEKKPFKLPFKMLIVGSHGSGKSNIVMTLIKLIGNVFDKIHLYTKGKDRPLYNYLEMVVPNKDLLEVHEGLDHLNSIDLIIFDGLEDEDQRKITDLYGRGRVLGCSLVYLVSHIGQ